METPEINEENCRYRISLGRSGEVAMSRFSNQLEALETEILSDWEDAIDEVVDRFSQLTVEELHNHTMGIENVEKAEERDLLLRKPVLTCYLGGAYWLA